MEVKTQEDFKDPGTGTLEKLDRYIADCDAVVHLVGEMTGAIAMDPSTEFIASKNPSVANKLPPLKEVLDKRLDVSYTQWEAWLALYHSKRLVIAEADRAAPRAPHFAPTDASRAAQQVHLRRLSVMERFPSCTFTSSDNLAKYILGGLILDLLTIDAIKSVEEKFNQGIYNNKTELQSILGDIQSNMAALNADKGSHIYESRDYLKAGQAPAKWAAIQNSCANISEQLHKLIFAINKKQAQLIADIGLKNAGDLQAALQFQEQKYKRLSELQEPVTSADRLEFGAAIDGLEALRSKVVDLESKMRTQLEHLH